jgi:glycerol-3-phosphate O-acyltransferase/dihydroxyacetone phosphate acyltransferase
MRRRFVGLLAAGLGCINVQRVWDTSRLGSGKIFAPDLQNDPRLFKGRDTRFDQEAEVGGWIMVVFGGRQTLRAKVAEIRGPRELYLETPFLEGSDFDTEYRLKAALTGTTYYLAPKRQGSSLAGIMGSVGAKLKAGATISLFPEGHSHDQPDLLPFKS